MLIAFHKPCGVLSQFTPDQPGQRTLADFGFPPRVYPLGRLDADSEGLLLLSDEGDINHHLLDPSHGHWRTYLAQVEGQPDAQGLLLLSEGVIVQGRRTLPARARFPETEPDFPERIPPIRFRKDIPTAWIELELHEGRNRQVRRMTAAVGWPTLRLIRIRMGKFALPADLPAGSWREISREERQLVFA